MQTVDGSETNPSFSGDRLGSSVAASGKYLLVGACFKERSGRVHFYELRYEESVTQTLCAGGSINFDTQVITTAGSYQATFTASDGLDSLVNLTVVASDLAINTTSTDLTCFGSNDGSISVTEYGWQCAVRIQYRRDPTTIPTALSQG